MERDANGEDIDYAQAVGGNLVLVPEGDARNALEKDYQAMIYGGLFEEVPPPFDELMAQCAAIQVLANTQAAD